MRETGFLYADTDSVIKEENKMEKIDMASLYPTFNRMPKVKMLKRTAKKSRSKKSNKRNR